MQPYVALRNQKEPTTMLSWQAPEIFRYISFLCFLWFCSVSVIYPLGAVNGDTNQARGLFPPGEVVHQVRHPAAVVIAAALLPPFRLLSDTFLGKAPLRARMPSHADSNERTRDKKQTFSILFMGV